MGLEGVENLTGSEEVGEDISEEEAAARQLAADPAPTHGTSGFQKLGESNTTRPTDEEVAAQREAELAEAREEHNQRTGGGAHPLSHER